MKKQLIAAAVALVLNNTAFAAPTVPLETPGQDVNVNFSIDGQPPTLTLGGTILGGGAATTSLDFDEHQLNSNTVRKNIGTFTVAANNYGSNYTGHCRLEITSTWELLPVGLTPAGAPPKILYGIAEAGSGSIKYGYSSQDATAQLANSPIQSSFVAGTGSPAPKNCNISKSLDVVIQGFNRPTLAANDTAQYTGLMTFKGTIP